MLFSLTTTKTDVVFKTRSSTTVRLPNVQEAILLQACAIVVEHDFSPGQEIVHPIPGTFKSCNSNDGATVEREEKQEGS